MVNILKDCQCTNLSDDSGEQSFCIFCIVLIIMNLVILQSKTISLLRFPLALMVVFIHSFGESASSYEVASWTNINGMDVYNIFRIFFSHVVSHPAVPVFFMISGFLFFYKIESYNWRMYFSKLRKRFRTVFIPYLIWNLIPILYIIMVKVGAFL